MQILIPLLVLAAGLVWRMLANQRRAAAGTVSVDAQLDAAERFALEGEWAKCLARLSDAEPLAAASKDGAGALRRAKCHLLRGEFFMAQNDPAAAHPRFQAASEECGRGLPPDASRDLAIAIQAGEVVIAARFLMSSDWAESTARLLAREPETTNPRVWLRLARAALVVAQVHHERGNWSMALRLFETAVRIGERIPPGIIGGAVAADDNAALCHRLARATASNAARILGSTLCTSGELEIGLAWLDRATGTLEALEDPLARSLRSSALLQRASDEPDDPIAGSPQRRRALERAIEEGRASGWSSGLGTASRAAMLLARHHADRGEFDAALARYAQALGVLDDATGPGACELATSAQFHHGLLLRDLGRIEEAIEQLRSANVRGRFDPDPDARSLATVSACHAHHLLLAEGQQAEARALLEGLEGRIPALRPDARIHAAVMVGRERAAQQFSEGRPDDAMETLASVEARAAGIPHPELREVARNVAADRGRIALSQSAPDQAIDHFARALDMSGGGSSLAADDLFRSDVTLEMARSMAQVGRIDEARVALQRAFELGRDSGRGSGRAGAAVAALNLGLSEEESWERRREWLEAAVRFGQLSGVPRGLEVAKTANQHLRELDA